MKNRLFITIFMLICICPAVLMLVPGLNNSAANEKKQAFPRAIHSNGKLNTSYPVELADLFDSKYALRSEMISLHNYMTAALFNESGESQVILGKDGWLFYAETLDDYTAGNLMSEREIHSIGRTLYLIEEYCTVNGVDFAFITAPNKNSLYADKMPDRYRYTDTSNAQLLFNELERTNTTFVNLFDVFEKEKKSLYRKTDTHWTTEGAGLAADEILKVLGKASAAYYKGKTLPASATNGDLHTMLYPALADKTCDIVYADCPQFQHTKPMRSYEDNFIFTGTPKKDGRLLMFRDSFGNTLYPFLAAEFKEAVFSRLIPYNLTMLSKYNSDVLLIEIAERNLNWLIEKAPVFPAIPKTALPASAKAVTPSFTSGTPSDELAGYTELTGEFAAHTLNARDNIYITSGEAVFEAVPGTANSFTAYVPNEFYNENIKFYLLGD